MQGVELAGSPNSPRASAAMPTLPAQDPASYRRNTPYGVFQELRHFMTRRKEHFINYWKQMAASRSRHKGQHTSQGLLSKTGIANVVYRCVPGASDPDVQYVVLLLQAVVPEAPAVSIKDMAYAVKQGATIEKLAGSGRLPHGIRELLSSLAEQFYNKRGQRTRRAFNQLDWNQRGLLSAHEQVALLHALAPSLLKSQLLWLSCCVYWYGEQEGRGAELSFEELAEALTWLAQQQPGRVQGDEGQEGEQAQHTESGWNEDEAYAQQQQQQQLAGGGGPHGYLGEGPPAWGYMQGPFPSAPDGAFPFMDPYQYQYGGLPHAAAGEYTYTYPSGGAVRIQDGSWAEGQHMAGAAEAGDAYCTWVLRSRQKVLQHWFADDHAKKVKLMEEEKAKLQVQVKLRSEILGLKSDVRAIETGMMNLTRQVEKNAWELTGLPPVLTLDLKGLTERVNKTMEEAIKITRSRELPMAAVAGAAGGGGTGEAAAAGRWLDPGLSLEELLERLTSNDWLSRMRLPENAHTLRLALDMRSSLMELQRMHRADALRMECERKQCEMEVEEARHGMALQVQLLRGQLNAQAAELQRRLLWDVHLCSSMQQQQQPQAEFWPTAPGPTPTTSSFTPVHHAHTSHTSNAAASFPSFQAPATSEAPDLGSFPFIASTFPTAEGGAWSYSAPDSTQPTLVPRLTSD